MIHSMTGYGGAQCVEDGVSYALEIRSVNNRYLKLAFKLSEHLQFVEPTIEKLLRGRIRRGSVMCSLRTRASGEALASSVNTEALQRYVDRLGTVRVPGGVQPSIDLAVVASLPGVCEPLVPEEQERARLLSIIESLTHEALDRLIEMRRVEGDAVRRELIGGCEAIRSRITSVTERAPSVIDEYHVRLEARVSLLMQKGGFELGAEGLMREVALFAERSDISEELARLDSHLEQFTELCDRGDKVGRTLDFLTQELLREANTIASKSADARIAQSIVEIKGWIDRLKEQAANVE